MIYLEIMDDLFIRVIIPLEKLLKRSFFFQSLTTTIQFFRAFSILIVDFYYIIFSNDDKSKQ